MTYRTGRTVPYTIYDDDVFQGSMRTDAMATRLVDAANGNLADLERFRSHSVKLNTVSWRLAEALGDIPPGATEYHGDDIETLVDRVIARLVEPIPDGAA